MKILPNQTILDRTLCPICGERVELVGNASLICQGPKRHCYDFSSSGYINLMPPGHASGGDSKEAVRARTSFLNLDLYRRVADELANAVTQFSSHNGQSLLLDAGCGEGYYTTILAQRGYSVIGADLSKFAVDAAAKRMAGQGFESGFFCVASVSDLPFADASVSVVTNVFAPCFEKEFSRILKKDGILAVVYAGPNHLSGLKASLYENVTVNDKRADLPETMSLVFEKRIQYCVTVFGNQNIKNLFAMTPYYWKTSVSDSEKLNGLTELQTEIDMVIAIYQKR